MADRLSRADVEHIAELAKLGLTEQEKERFGEQLSAILAYAQSLQQLDTDAIPPTAQVIDLKNVMRADKIEPSLPAEQALANAPHEADGYFRVKPILDER